MSTDEQVLSGSVTTNSSTNVMIDFERQVKHLSIKAVTQNAYVGFDTAANTADALIETGNGWVDLMDTPCTKLYVLGAGAGTFYYIVRR